MRRGFFFINGGSKTVFLCELHRQGPRLLDPQSLGWPCWADIFDNTDGMSWREGGRIGFITGNTEYYCELLTGWVENENTANATLVGEGYESLSGLVLAKVPEAREQFPEWLSESSEKVWEVALPLFCESLASPAQPENPG